MAKKVEHISLKKSTVAGKAPTTDVLVDGELAVNIAEGGEKIFLRNTKPEIVEFSSDKLLDKKYLSTTSGGTVNGETTFNKDVKIVYPDSGSTPVSLREVMVDNEMTVAAALNDLNTRVNEQKTDIDSIKTKEYLPLSGGTVNGNLTVTGNTTFEDDVRITNGNFIGEGIEIKGVNAIYEFERGDNINVWINNGTTKPLNEFFQTSGGTINGDLTVTGNTEFNGDVKIVYPDSSSQTVSLREVMVENEKVTAAALNDLNERNDELSAKVTEQKTDIDNLSQKYLPLSGGTVTGDTTFTKDVKVVFPNSETPTSLVGAIVSNEKVTSAALNNLNEKVNDHKSDIDNLKAQKNLPLSGGTVTGEATFSGGLKFRYPDVSSTPVSLRDVIADNEEVTAAALNDLNDKINNISVVNAPLIIKDGNKKYKVNIAKGVELGLFTEIQ